MIEIDAQEAEARFGPCWEDVLKVISQAESLTFDQIARAAALVEVLDEAALNAAWTAVVDAVWEAGRLAAWNAAWFAARDAVVFASRPGAAVGGQRGGPVGAAAWAAGRAAVAAVVSDQVDKHGLTAAHIAVLTQVWRVIIGAS